MNSLFQVFEFIVFGIVLFCVYFYVSKNISRYGFNCINMFVMIYTLFYVGVPFVVLFFKQIRDTTTLYNRVLNVLSDEEIFLNFIICVVILSIMLVAYHGKSRKKVVQIAYRDIEKVNVFLYSKIDMIANIILVVGLISILIIIKDVGGITSYLALGSATRGTTSTANDFLSSGMLPLITLSQIILVPPYLYYYQMKVNKRKIIVLKYVVSMFFAVLYLLYNQGRAPLLLFILPFILVSKIMKRTKLIGIVMLFILCFPLLDYLGGLFNYFSYGVYRTSSTNILSSFLIEYSYPFSNFANRGELIEYGGFRYMFDYVYWVITIVPSSILRIIGLSKNSIELVGTVNTNAYSYITGIPPMGGIPVDFLTYQYYEGGYVILLIAVIITAKFLKNLDMHFWILKNNIPVQILLYRISVSILNIMTNSDLSVIARTRMDVIILCIVAIYISNTTTRINNNIDCNDGWNK